MPRARRVTARCAPSRAAPGARGGGGGSSRARSVLTSTAAQACASRCTRSRSSPSPPEAAARGSRVGVGSPGALASHGQPPVRTAPPGAEGSSSPQQPPPSSPGPAQQHEGGQPAPAAAPEAKAARPGCTPTSSARSAASRRREVAEELMKGTRTVYGPGRLAVGASLPRRPRRGPLGVRPRSFQGASARDRERRPDFFTKRLEGGDIGWHTSPEGPRRAADKMGSASFVRRGVRSCEAGQAVRSCSPSSPRR
jgi:hypothetical protein